MLYEINTVVVKRSSHTWILTLSLLLHIYFIPAYFYPLRIFFILRIFYPLRIYFIPAYFFILRIFMHCVFLCIAILVDFRVNSGFAWSPVLDGSPTRRVAAMSRTLFSEWTGCCTLHLFLLLSVFFCNSQYCPIVAVSMRASSLSTTRILRTLCIYFAFWNMHTHRTFSILYTCPDIFLQSTFPDRTMYISYNIFCLLRNCYNTCRIHSSCWAEIYHLWKFDWSV